MFGIAAFTALAMLLASKPGRALFRSESAMAAGGVAASLLVLLALTKAG